MQEAFKGHDTACRQPQLAVPIWPRVWPIRGGVADHVLRTAAQGGSQEKGRHCRRLEIIAGSI